MKHQALIDLAQRKADAINAPILAFVFIGVPHSCVVSHYLHGEPNPATEADDDATLDAALVGPGQQFPPRSILPRDYFA